MADICPHCQTRQTTSVPLPQKPAEVLRGWLANVASFTSALAVLAGFFLPWFHPLRWPLFFGLSEATHQALEARLSLSGLDLARQQFLAHEFYSPQTLPGDFALLWLVPMTALLLLGAETVRVGQMRAPGWLRFWAALAVCASVVSMVYLFFESQISPTITYVDTEYGFWLTCTGLVVATMLLLRRRRYVGEFSRARRAMLFTGLNWLAVLGVGATITGFFVSEQQSYARARGVRAVFPTGIDANFPLGNVLTWSPDSKTLLARTAPPPSSLLWEGGLPQLPLSLSWRQSGGVQFAMLEIQQMTAQSWSPDGRLLAMTIAGQTEVYCWYTENWAVFRSYAVPGPGKVSLRGLAWSPDSQHLAAGVDGTTPGRDVLYVWEVASGKRLTAYALPFQMSAGVYTVAWSPDGSALAASGVAGNRDNLTGFVIVWDVATGQVRFQHIAQERGVIISALGWSPDSRLLAFADSSSSDGSFTQIEPGVLVQVWDVMANRPGQSYVGHILGINCLTWSPDGKLLAAGGDDETVQVWDTTSGERVLLYQGHQGQYESGSMVLDVAWSPDGSMIASTTTNEIRIWDAP